jgi:hypothetical protein
MKPFGFQKKAATFSRTHATHTESFNIQASQWNGDWGRHFYVNCDLVFTGIPFLTSSQKRHWHNRIEKIVPTAPWKFEYSEETIDAVRKDLAQSLLLATDILTSNIEVYRREYLDRAEKWEAQNQ